MPAARKPKATRTFTVKALDAELGRRSNNQARKAKGDKPVRPASFVFPKLSASDIDAIKGGAIVKAEFKLGRVELVGVKAAA